MAHIVSEEAMLFVGVVVLAMCIAIDVCMAYKRGAVWVPGYAVTVYALCLQLVGYLDVHNVSIGASTHKEQQLEVLVSKQLSIDTSRLVLLVFLGHLLPDLASAKGFWTTLAALCTSLSMHIAIEVSAFFLSPVTVKDKLGKGQSRIWLIVSDFVLSVSVLHLLFYIPWAIFYGRFTRDNLGSRIPFALKIINENVCPGNNYESAIFYQSEMLKSWIVARVSQPEYVLNRSAFSFYVARLLTFNAVFMGGKIICLRSQLHGLFPLFTLRCFFIILGWCVVSYRYFINLVWFLGAESMPELDPMPDLESLRNPMKVQGINEGSVMMRCFGPIITLEIKLLKEYIRNPIVQCVVIGLLLLCLLSILIGFILVLVVLVMNMMLCVCVPLHVMIGRPVLLLRRRFGWAPPDPDADFRKYRETLKWVCMPRDKAENLWVANEKSFADMKTRTWDQAYQKGRKSEMLQNVIGSRLAENIPLSKDVEKLLEPLESVERYFPLLRDSFRSITILALLMKDNVSEGADEDNSRSVSTERGNVREAFEKAGELVYFRDCPDNIGISLDIFKLSNLEAFLFTCASLIDFKQVRFDFRGSSTVANAVEKVCNEAEEKLKMCRLLGDVHQEAVFTDWRVAAEAYAKYKVCKLILDRPAEGESVEQLQRYLLNVAADLIAMSVKESPKLLLERSRKWAAEFKEDKTSAAIQLAGFTNGVIDGVKAEFPSIIIDWGLLG